MATRTSADPADERADPLGWSDADAAAEPYDVHVPLHTLAVGRPLLVDFLRAGRPASAIIVQHDDDVHVYVNRCPHVTYSLDFGDGEVMDASGKFLMCHAHGAMFLPESGECFMGPCVGKALERLPFRREEGEVVLTVTPEPDVWP